MTGYITTEINTERFSRRMAEVHDALIGNGQEADAALMVLDEGKRLVRQIVRFTPPQSQQQGEQAVERELNSLISEADQLFIDEIVREHGAENVDAYRTGRDGSPMHLKWEHVLTSENDKELERLHNTYKDRRGKIPKYKGGSTGEWNARIVVPKGNKRPFIDKIKSRAGRWKASWGSLAERLGLRLEPWVARHLPSPNAIGSIEGMREGTFPVITLGSRAPGVGAQRHNIQEALRVRGEAMYRRAALIVSGYNKDIARGMKIEARQAREAYADSHPENEYGSSGISY